MTSSTGSVGISPGRAMMGSGGAMMHSGSVAAGAGLGVGVIDALGADVAHSLGRTAGAVSRTARRGGRLAIGAAAVVAGLAGLAGASWVTLLHQIRTTSTLIDAATRAAHARSTGAASSTSDTGAGGDAASETGAAGGTGVAIASPPGAPRGDGVYLPDGTGPLERARVRALVLAMLGDSTAVGYGCATADEVPGVVLARGVAAALHRPVRVVTHGVVGSGAADLARQITVAMADGPDVAVIVVGSNDVRHEIPPRREAAEVGRAVAQLRERGVPVVVGTCPDLGVMTPIPQPLRRVVGLWSRTLAARQERAVVAAGGVPVPIARLVSPEFYGRPDLFYVDGFHPSGPGYAKAVAALLPEVLAALQ